jgi:hypothetical protein
VVGEQSRELGAESQFRHVVAGHERRVDGAAAGPVHRVEVNVVDVVVVVGRHLEPEVHSVAPPDANHRPWDPPLEGHVLERDTGFDLRDELLRPERYVVFARLVPVDRRRYVGRVGRDPVHVDAACGVQLWGYVRGRFGVGSRLRVHGCANTASNGADRSNPESCNHLPSAEVL